MSTAPNAFPIRPLNILDLNPPKPDLVRETIQVNGQPFVFFYPIGDDTRFGTLSCLANDKFSLSKVTFAPSDVFVDIGSNIGLVGLIVAKLFPGTKVYAFDASDLSVKAARQSAAANGLTNYLAFQVAVSAESKKGVQFYSNGKDRSCLVCDGLNSSNPVPEIMVDQIAIDELFDSKLLGIDRIRMMKIDIEGGEFAVFDRLFGPRKDLLDRIDYLHIEIHPYEQYDPMGLESKLRARFGNRVFFDT